MPLDTALTALAGAVLGLGLAMILAGFRARSLTSTDPYAGSGELLPWRTELRLRAAALLDKARTRWGEAVARRAGIAVAAFVAVGLLTRWPVGALLAGLGAWALPRVWAPDAAATADTDLLEGVAVWTEMLRDTLSAAAGLEQAVLATAATAPDALAEPVAALAARIREGDPLQAALHAFADDIDDPTADLVVAALVLAATRQARDLTGLLTSLAQAARDQVVLRLRVAASRSRIRTNVRIILATVLAMAATLAVVNRGYLAAYDTATGQLVLAAIGGIFAISFAWLGRIAVIPRPARILAPTNPVDDTLRASAADVSLMPGGPRATGGRS